MTAIALRRRRSSFGVPRRVSVESMDRETLLTEAIYLDDSIGSALDIDWVADDETCRRVGWHLVRNTRTMFHIGRRLLELTTPGGALLPPPEYRMCRETEPTDDEMFAAPMLQSWSLILFQSGSLPAYWSLSGTVYHRGHNCRRVWTRLLHLNRDKAMAMTSEGCVKLGRRM